MKPRNGTQAQHSGHPVLLHLSLSDDKKTSHILAPTCEMFTAFQNRCNCLRRVGRRGSESPAVRVLKPFCFNFICLLCESEFMPFLSRICATTSCAFGSKRASSRTRLQLRILTAFQLEQEDACLVSAQGARCDKAQAGVLNLCQFCSCFSADGPVTNRLEPNLAAKPVLDKVLCRSVKCLFVQTLKRKYLSIVEHLTNDISYRL